MTREDFTPGFPGRCLRTLIALAALALFASAAPGEGERQGPQAAEPLTPAALSALQSRLAASGDYFGAPDGTLSLETTRALRRFQIRRGLPVTGLPDAETLRQIGQEEAERAAAASSSSSQVAAPPAAANGPEAAAAMPATGVAAGPQPFFDTTAPLAAAGPQGRPSGGLLAFSRFATAPPAVQNAVLADAAAALTARRLLAPAGSGQPPWLSPAFTAALREFQTAEGLEAGGFLDDPTLERLGLIPPPRQAPASESASPAGPPRRVPAGNPSRH